MSSFRLICIAALTVAMVGFVANAAAAQSAIATDQSGKPYLAGLRPPHASYKLAHAKARHVSIQHKATTNTARPETKRRPTKIANSKAHRPARLADKINSRVAWPRVEPAAADERSTSETVLQFATEDTGSTPAVAPRPTVPAPTISTAKTAPSAKIAATDGRDNVDAGTVGKSPPTASTLVQTERFEAPASGQMRVILPAQSETPVQSKAPATAPTPKDQPPAHSNALTAPMLATLAGAITAGLVGWLMIGFGSDRAFKSRRT